MGASKSTQDDEANDRTCFRDQASVICVDCFDHQEHEGHEIIFTNNYNFVAVCDCGELDQYKDASFHSCLLHQASVDPVPPFDPFRTDSNDIPPEFIQALYQTFSTCVDYIISILQISVPAGEWGILPADLQEMTTSYNEDWTPLPPEIRKKGPWAVVVYTDDKHNEPEVIRQVEHAMGIDYQEASDIVRQMDGYVRLALAPCH